MNKIILILVGLFMISIGIDALVTGETTGFSAGKTAGYTVFYDTDPIEFTLNTIISFGIGIWLLKCCFFGTGDEQRSSTAKPNSTDLASKRR